jgi:hypothetical protein
VVRLRVKRNSMAYKDKAKEKGAKRAWFQIHKERAYESHRIFLTANPWNKSLCAIRSRCSNPKHHYYKNGIKNFLNAKDVEHLWFRDNADEMEYPSIDRINTKGNYTLDNCRYIELSDNLKRKRK